MSITYRDGELADAEAIAAMFAESFVDTFGHLYRPEDLAEFLSGVTAQAFVDELADDRFAFRLALDGARLAGFAKLGPAQLPVETPPDTIELYQLYVLPAWKGRGIAADLMDWALRAAAGVRRGTSSSASMSTIIARGAFTSVLVSSRSDDTTSWLEARPTRTSC